MIHKVTKLVHRSTLKSETVDHRAMKYLVINDLSKKMSPPPAVRFLGTDMCWNEHGHFFCWCVSSLLTAFRFNRAKHFGMPGTSRDHTNNTKNKKNTAGKGKQSKPDPRGIQMLQKF